MNDSASAIPPAWLEAVHRLEGARRVLVLGASDVGKSTFCRFLAERLGAALLDTDLGQKTVGPPGAVTLGRSDASLAALHFVGATSPSKHFLPLLVGVARLAAHAESLVVDTSGFIESAGAMLKAQKAEAVLPDHIVAIERGGELAPVLAPLAHLPIVRLAPAPQARRRTDSERAAARRAAFAAHFAGATERHLDRRTVVLQRRDLPEHPAGLLCGALDSAGICRGLALVLEADENSIRVLSPVPEIRVLQLGTLRLAADGTELRRL